VRFYNFSQRKFLQFQKSYLKIEVSRGGNSHQSETNLIKTPEASLPAPFGVPIKTR